MNCFEPFLTLQPHEQQPVQLQIVGGEKRSFEVRKQFRTAEGDFPDALAVLKFDFSSKIPVVFFLRTDARRNLCTCV